LGERLLCKQEVVGSIPSGSTNPGWSRDRAVISSMNLNLYRVGLRSRGAGCLTS
jgi:hypothetical protein